jgi:hypothetical protein
MQFNCARVVTNYTCTKSFDLSYLFFRIKNAVLAIFGRSEWQQMVSQMAQNKRARFALIEKFDWKEWLGGDTAWIFANHELRKLLQVNRAHVYLNDPTITLSPSHAPCQEKQMDCFNKPSPHTEIKKCPFYTTLHEKTLQEMKESGLFHSYAGNNKDWRGRCILELNSDQVISAARFIKKYAKRIHSLPDFLSYVSFRISELISGLFGNSDWQTMVWSIRAGHPDAHIDEKLINDALSRFIRVESTMSELEGPTACASVHTGVLGPAQGKFKPGDKYIDPATGKLRTYTEDAREAS